MIQLPFWLQNKPDSWSKHAAEQRFRLRLAALYATEKGTLAALAVLLEINESTLKSQALCICRTSEKTRIGIRRLLGEHFVPPDIRTRDNSHDL